MNSNLKNISDKNYFYCSKAQGEKLLEEMRSTTEKSEQKICARFNRKAKKVVRYNAHKVFSVKAEFVADATTGKFKESEFMSFKKQSYRVQGDVILSFKKGDVTLRAEYFVLSVRDGKVFPTVTSCVNFFYIDRKGNKIKVESLSDLHFAVSVDLT
jgi:hypothetical protein